MNLPVTRRHILEMAGKGKYYEADCAVNSNIARKCALQIERWKDLEEEQALQWQAFNRAKQQFNIDVQLEAITRKESKRKQLRRRQKEDRIAHRDEIDAFAERLTSVVMRRPVPIYLPSVDLRKDEKRLASQNKFLEAAASAETAKKIEDEVLRKNVSEKQIIIAAEIKKREEENREKELTALKNCRAKMLLEENKARVELACAKARLQHMATDMSAAHERQRRELRHFGYVPNISIAQRSKASRGTSLAQKVMGDKLPSLTTMYGHLVDDYLNNYNTRSLNEVNDLSN